MFIVIEVAFEEEVYSISEGGEVDAVIRKSGETIETICVAVSTESRTASGACPCVIRRMSPGVSQTWIGIILCVWFLHT